MQQIKKTAIILLILTFLTPRAAQAESSVLELLKHLDNLYRGGASYAELTMQVKTENFERQLTLEAWSRGNEHSLIKILAPKKEKGITTLKSANQIWNYLPKTNRVIKVPSSMMAANWMGSHFTNDDLVKESRYSDDYNCKKEKQSAELITLQCFPKPDAAIVWGRVDLNILAQSHLPKEINYYDEDLLLVRTLAFDQIKTLGGRELPARLTMLPKDKPTEKTIITYNSIKFDVDIAEDLFSIRSLKRKGRR